MPMIAQMKAHRWNSLAFGLIVAVMAHLGVAADAGRLDEPWPVLLSSEPGEPRARLSRRCTSAPMDRLRGSCGRHTPRNYSRNQASTISSSWILMFA